jgi:hypothetical protein
MIKIFSHPNLLTLEDEINKFVANETHRIKITNVSINQSDVLIIYKSRRRFLKRICSLFRRK